MSKLCFVTPFIIATATIICIVSLATTWWCVVSHLPGYEGVHSGLWLACYCNALETECIDLTSVRLLQFTDVTWLYVVRAMVSISILLSLATLPLAVISTAKSSWIFSTAAALLTLAQAATSMIGLAVFNGEIYALNINVGVISVSWSYCIGWAGVGFYITGTVCLIIETIMFKRRNLYENIHQ